MWTYFGHVRFPKTSIAIEHGPFIVELPSCKMVIFHSYVNVHQRVSSVAKPSINQPSPSLPQAVGQNHQETIEKAKLDQVYHTVFILGKLPILPGNLT